MTSVRRCSRNVLSNTLKNQPTLGPLSLPKNVKVEHTVNYEIQNIDFFDKMWYFLASFVFVKNPKERS